MTYEEFDDLTVDALKKLTAPDGLVDSERLAELQSAIPESAECQSEHRGVVEHAQDKIRGNPVDDGLCGFRNSARQRGQKVAYGMAITPVHARGLRFRP